MPTAEKTTTTTKQSWADWMGPGDPEPEELFTRAEIVEQANTLIGTLGKPVSASDLQLWEKLGVLPRAIRLRRGDAQYALYPDWHAYLVRNVRQLQREGYSLDEIKPRIRAYARLVLGHGRTPLDEEISHRLGRVQSPEQLMLWPVLVEELERLGRWWSHLQGVEVDRIEVHVVGTNGRATKYPLPIAPHNDTEID
jgi:DNA-binding transcriptional MerR regulator